MVKPLCVSVYLIAILVGIAPVNGGPQVGHNKINIVNNYSKITSIDQMLHIFNSSALYIDLWATWCEPCIDEFQFSESLHHFLAKKNIEILYLSYDDDESDKVWRRDIFKYQLKGNHIRATNKLREQISQLVWGLKDGYSLPHYLLFNKSGVLLCKDMPPPSEKSKLYSNIDSLFQVELNKVP